MLNRGAVIVRFKEPFLRWINEADPDPGDPVSLEDANHDSTVYLVHAEEPAEFDSWLRLNAKTFFEQLLEDWYTDPDLWPKKRDLKTLKEWCTIEFHSLVLDTGGPPLEYEDL